MKMVSHQHLSMNFPTVALANLTQPLQEKKRVGIVIENKLTTIAPSHHVIETAPEYSILRGRAMKESIAKIVQGINKMFRSVD